MEKLDFLKEINQALLFCVGTTQGEGGVVLYYLYGLPDRQYFTIELSLLGGLVPTIIPCDKDAACILFDDASHRFVGTLNTEKEVQNIRDGLIQEMRDKIEPHENMEEGPDWIPRDKDFTFPDEEEEEEDDF